MNDDTIKKRVEKDLPRLEARVARVENNHGCIDDIKKQLPDIEIRVSMLEKKQEYNEDIQRRVAKMEANFDVITEKQDKIELKIDSFIDKIRSEFNRFIGYVALIILTSLCSGIIIMFIYQGNINRGLSKEIYSTSDRYKEKIGELKAEFDNFRYKIETKTDTIK